MSAHVPVVLVHGYLAAKLLMLPMQRALGKAGLEAHTIDLPCLNLDDIRASAAVLQRNLEALLARLGSERCDLVGVSLGGHMALYYIKQLQGAKRVRRMVAVGTPFGGTWASMGAVLTVGLFSPAARQTLPGSRFIRELAAGPLPVGVEYFSIFARQDPIAPPERCRLEGATNIEVRSLPLPFTHQGLGVAAPVLDAVVHSLL